MKPLTILITLLLSFSVMGQASKKPKKMKEAVPNVEIQATYKKDNANFIYMESKTEKFKLKKSELTEEGVKAILNNKEKNLTLFVPPKSIVQRVAKPDEDI